MEFSGNHRRPAPAPALARHRCGRLRHRRRRPDIVTGTGWYENPGRPDGSWKRREIGPELGNALIVHDFDGDEHHQGAHIVDIDGDGAPDILSVGYTHDRVMLYENRAFRGGGMMAHPKF